MGAPAIVGLTHRIHGRTMLINLTNVAWMVPIFAPGSDFRGVPLYTEIRFAAGFDAGVRENTDQIIALLKGQKS